MKKYIAAFALLTALVGCEDANKAIDQAQQAANKAVDGLQETVESLDVSKLNLEQLGDATELANEFAMAVELVTSTDFSDPQALLNAQEKLANTYKCLVDATSESTAEKLLDNLLTAIGSQESLSMIEQGIEKAKAAQECVM